MNAPRPSPAPLGFRAMIAALLALLAPPAARAQARIWTSVAGTQIEARHVATIGGEVWLRDKSGRLIKVAPDQLATPDRERLAATTREAGEWHALDHGVLFDPRKDPHVVEVAGLLEGTIIPAFSCSGLPLAEALERYAEAIAAADSAGRRLEFRVSPECRQGPVSMTTRGLSAHRGLQLICGNQPEPLAARIIPGGMELAPAARLTKAAAPAPATASGTDGSAHGRGLSDLRSAARRCERSTDAKNRLRGGDFEVQFSAWEVVNQPKAFKRAPVGDLNRRPQSPALGERVLTITPLPPDQTHQMGPPYITQTVKFSRRPKRVLFCADILNGTDQGGTIRFSVTDPKIAYLHGTGNTFPFSQTPFRNGETWQHLEWEADLAALKNNELTFGLMFPSIGTAWHCDNVTVRVLED